METYIGQDTRIEGKIVTSGSLRIDGEVDGDIQGEGDVVIGETGHVRAGIKAVNLIIAGEVSGEARVSGRLELFATGRMYGDALHADAYCRTGRRIAREQPYGQRG